MTAFCKVRVAEGLGARGFLVADPEHGLEGRVRGIFVEDGGDKVGVGGGDGQLEVAMRFGIGVGHCYDGDGGGGIVKAF